MDKSAELQTRRKLRTSKYPTIVSAVLCLATLAFQTWSYYQSDAISFTFSDYHVLYGNASQGEFSVYWIQPRDTELTPPPSSLARKSPEINVRHFKPNRRDWRPFHETSSVDIGFFIIARSSRYRQWTFPIWSIAAVFALAPVIQMRRRHLADPRVGETRRFTRSGTFRALVFGALLFAGIPAAVALNDEFPNVGVRIVAAGYIFALLAAFAVPIWALFRLIAFAGRRADRLLTQRELRNPCSNCGYSLVGNVSGICPECGTPAPDKSTLARELENVRVDRE